MTVKNSNSKVTCPPVLFKFIKILRADPIRLVHSYTNTSNGKLYEVISNIVQNTKLLSFKIQLKKLIIRPERKIILKSNCCC